MKYSTYTKISGDSTNLKSDTIVSAIRDVLLRSQISSDNCRSQCYDSASNILGKK